MYWKCYNKRSYLRQAGRKNVAGWPTLAANLMVSPNVRARHPIVEHNQVYCSIFIRDFCCDGKTHNKPDLCSESGIGVCVRLLVQN